MNTGPTPSGSNRLRAWLARLGTIDRKMLFALESLPPPPAQDGTRPKLRILDWLFRVEPLETEAEPSTPSSGAPHRLSMVFAVEKLPQDPETPSPPPRAYLKWLVGIERLD